MVKYKMTTFFRQYGGNKKFTPHCHAIIFRNNGDVPAIINKNWRLEPGDETPPISTVHPNVVDETEYSIAFDTGGGGTTKLVGVIYTQIIPVESKSSGDACETL